MKLLYRLWIENMGSPAQLFKTEELQPLGEGLALNAPVKISKATHRHFEGRTATVRTILKVPMSKNSKLLLLDLNSAVRRPKSRLDFISNPTDQEIIPEAKASIEYYVSLGWTFVGITNQGGVGAGYKTMQSCIEEQKFTLELLPQLETIYFCPDFQGKECWVVSKEIEAQEVGWIESDLIGQYRKPRPGMLHFARRYFAHTGAMAHEFLYVGDRPEDESAAKAACVRFMSAETWWKFGEKPDGN